MIRLSNRAIAYRHVVFPGEGLGAGELMNFGLPAAAPELPLPAPSREALSDNESQCVQWLFEQAGLNPEDYRPETIKRRIPACLRALRVETPAEIRSVVCRQPQLLRVAIGTLIIGVTAFFRDPPVFAMLSESILPGMLARPSGPRIWSAGCSDGAELYSVALLLAQRGALRRATMLGTDCRADALARAREGAYEPNAVRHVPAPLLRRYLKFDGARWRVDPYLVAAAQWRNGNVLNTSEPGGWDLILCRNMGIYMQPHAAARLWARLVQSLRPGGMLMLGKAERPYGARGLVPIAPCLYRRNGS